VGTDPGPFLRRHGFWSGVVVRLLPGNFGAANLLAGVLNIPRRRFLAGNGVGLLIELGFLWLALDRAFAALRRPSLGNVLGAGALLGALGGVGIFVRRRLRATVAKPTASPSTSPSPSSRRS
jgi:uncharacterized membrane protein YdjX (TVP38/TMEM64 family)